MDTPGAAPAAPRWPRRFNVVGLCFCSTFICYLDRVNISIDSLDPDTYRRVTRGGELDKALQGVDAALEAGQHRPALPVAP